MRSLEYFDEEILSRQRSLYIHAQCPLILPQAQQCSLQAVSLLVEARNVEQPALQACPVNLNMETSVKLMLIKHGVNRGLGT